LAELLRFLTSPSDVRADAIRQFHEHQRDLAEVLMDSEADRQLRNQVIDALIASLGSRSLSRAV